MKRTMKTSLGLLLLLMTGGVASAGVKFFPRTMENLKTDVRGILKNSTKLGNKKINLESLNISNIDYDFNRGLQRFKAEWTDGKEHGNAYVFKSHERDHRLLIESLSLLSENKEIPVHHWTSVGFWPRVDPDLMDQIEVALGQHYRDTGMSSARKQQITVVNDMTKGLRNPGEFVLRWLRNGLGYTPRLALEMGEYPDEGGILYSRNYENNEWELEKIWQGGRDENTRRAVTFPVMEQPPISR